MTTRVVQIHDAAIDEYMATLLLTTMDDVQLDGIVVVNADCIYGPAMTAAWRIQQFIERPDIPLTLSNARGINPFPWPYRGDCIKQGNVSTLFRLGDPPDWPPYPDGEAWLVDYLRKLLNSGEKATLLVLCPMTPVAELLQRHRDLAKAIDHLIWMGGAIHVKGNLDPTTLPTANLYAEWNVFWDPPAAEWVLKHARFPITMFPLDITDHVPITKEFMTALTAQGVKFPYSELAAQSYSLVATEVFYDMWDVVTTCYLTRKDLFAKPQRMSLRVAEYGAAEGGIFYPADDDRNPVDVVLALQDQKGFYDYVLEQFGRKSVRGKRRKPSSLDRPSP